MEMELKLWLGKEEKNINIFACIGSGGVGFSFCCKNIVAPINIGQTPIIKNDGGSQGIKPKILKTEVTSQIPTSQKADFFSPQ